MHFKIHTIPFLFLYIGNNIDISKKKYYNKKRKYFGLRPPKYSLINMQSTTKAYLLKYNSSLTTCILLYDYYNIKL